MRRRCLEHEAAPSTWGSWNVGMDPDPASHPFDAGLSASATIRAQLALLIPLIPAKVHPESI